ncbi:MAG: DNA-binding protein WhiA [Chitinophagales bacterium]
MGFSSEAKNELARLIPSRPCCRKAELAALVRLTGVLQLGRRSPGLTVTSENAAVARLTLTLFRLAFAVEAEVVVRRRTRLRKNNIYAVELPPSAPVTDLLHELGVLSPDGEFARALPEDLLAHRCCRKAYLRGAFLARGSVTDPERGYHLEIGGDEEEHLAALSRLLGTFELESNLTGRKGEPALYLKEADQIVRFLGLIGASAAVLAFENVRVKRDVRNRVNRLVNAESANMEKTAAAAVDQLEDIELIRTRLGFKHLPLALRQAAEARLAFPEASLRELGELVTPPVGKSGINYRMRRLAEIAQKLRIEAPSNKSRNRE